MKTKTMAFRASQRTVFQLEVLRLSGAMDRGEITLQEAFKIASEKSGYER